MLEVIRDAFCDELNAAIDGVRWLPRVRFECNVGEAAEVWLKKKHANGAVHEPATLAAFLAIRKRFNSKQIFDVGALHGYFTLFALQIFDADRVTAFEMHPGALGALEANVSPWAKIVPAVVSDQSRSQVKFWISGFNIYEEPDGGWEMLETIPGAMKPRGQDNRGRGFAMMDFITIDDYCATRQAPDLLKIDVEGFQGKAIAGALGTIAKHRPAIIIELHDPEKIARFGITNKSTVQPLFDLGYSAYWCGNFRDAEARFEPVAAMGERHEKLSIMVFVP